MFVAPMGFFAGGTATEGELLKRIKFDSSVDTGITYQGGAAPEIEASTGRRVLTCNGGKYLTIDNFESVHGADIIATGKMTVSFWFKADSGQTLTLNEFQSLWGKSPYRNSNMLILDTRQHWGAQYRLNPGLYAMYTASNSFTLSAGGIPLGTGTPNPAYGAWHHISMVYTGTDIEIYIDGNLAASNFENGAAPSSLSAVMANGVAFAVGHNPAYTGTVAFKGKISDFHLHNKALTQAEVQTVKDSYETVPTVALTESNDGTDITLGVTLTDPGSVASGWAYRINTPLGAIGAPHGGTLQTGNSVVITGQSAALHTIYVAAVDASGNVVGPSQTIQSDLRDVQALVRSDLNRYFHFNGDLNDYSTNNNHATMAVGTATYTTDKWNQKAFLPQDNAVVDSGHPMISTDTTYTISAWVYSDVTANDVLLCSNSYHYVTWGPGGIYLNFGGSANATGFNYRHSNSNVTPYTCATPSLSTGAWHHVVAVQNGSTMQVWVDGVKETEITNATNPPFNTTNNMIIGGIKSNQGGDGGWRFEATDMKIDEFAYWTKSLTQAEIEYLWNSGNGRHIYDPASTIDASVTVTGSTVDITATLGDPAGNGGGGWAYSTSALGAVGAPHGGTAVPSGNTAQITGAADGSYTLYYALIDGSGNVVVKDSTTYGVGLSGDIVANWNFDGNANSSVGSGLNGTATGVTQVAGRADSSFAYQAAATTDRIDITGTNLLPGATNELSVSLWIYGTEASLPAATTLIEAQDASNNRVFNLHFWSDSNLYWDAGNSGGSSYDRMNKAMSTSENEGQWNHWICTKNATTGDMKVYLNGALWHSATGKTRTISPISKIRILNALYSLDKPYLGKLDSLVIYKKELSAAEVLSIHNSEIVPTITAATSVSGGTVSITATLTDPGSAATGGWAYSTSALGAVGQPHGGTAVSSGTTAQITGAADGTYTLYVALIDSSGNVVGAKSDSEYVVGAITLTAFQTDSYGDSWNGASVAISPQGGAVMWTLTGPASGVKAPAGKTDTLAVAPGTYSYSVTPGSYPGEVAMTITDQYGNTLASLTGNSGTGTFVVATQVTAFQVHGYYPLYNTAADANSAAEGNGTSHTHVLDSVTYYMPNGIAGGPGGGNQFHGTYGQISKYGLDYDATDSWGTNGGTVTNATFATTGNKKQAVFDGTGDYIEISDDSSLNSTTGTVSFWINTTSNGGSTAELLIGKTDSSASKNGWNVVNDGGNLSFQIKDGASGNVVIVSTSAINNGAWRHVAVVYESGGTSKVYVDGSEEASSASTPTFTVSSNNLRIGKSLDTFWEDFDGSMDDVRIWNRKLADSEISSLHSAGREDANDQLIGVWNFDSANANDSEGSDNGTASNVTFATAAGRSYADFSGTSSSIALSNDPFTASDATFTMSMWVKHDSLAASQRYMSWGSSGGRFFFGYNSGSSRVDLGMGATTTIASSATYVPTLGEWEMWTVSNSGTTTKFYKNGQLISTETHGTTGAINSGQTVRIGAQYSSNGEHFDGKMDDVRVWSRVLSDTEVETLYSTTLALEDGMVSKYALDYDAYDTVGTNDLTENGTVAYVNGAADFNSTGGYLESASTIDLTGAFTISMWAKIDNSQNVSGHDYSTMFNYGAGSSYLDFYVLNNKIRAQHTDSNGVGDNRGTTALSAGWNHLVLVMDPDSNIKKAYLNGVEETWDASYNGGFSGTFASAQTFRLGWNWGSTSYNPDNSLNDVRIWNRVLSASEISTLNSAGAETTRTLATNLTAHYTLDSDASATVGSAGTNSGATFSTVGSHSFASFDGSNDSITIPHSNAEQPFNTDSTSVSMWLKTTTSSESRVLFKGYGPSSNESLWDHRVMTNGKAYFYWRDETAGVIKTLTSTTSVNDGSWHHVLVVRDGSTLKMYVDGSLEATATGVSGTWSGTYDMYLGKWDHPSYSASHWFDGSLDEVKIWSHALSATEATALYNEGH